MYFQVFSVKTKRPGAWLRLIFPKWAVPDWPGIPKGPGSKHAALLEEPPTSFCNCLFGGLPTRNITNIYHILSYIYIYIISYIYVSYHIYIYTHTYTLYNHIWHVFYTCTFYTFGCFTAFPLWRRRRRQPPRRATRRRREFERRKRGSTQPRAGSWAWDVHPTEDPWFIHIYHIIIDNYRNII